MGRSSTRRRGKPTPARSTVEVHAEALGFSEESHPVQAQQRESGGELAINDTPALFHGAIGLRQADA